MFQTCCPERRRTVRQSEQWHSFLWTWRRDLRSELATNASGRLSRKQPKLAADLGETFLASDDATDVVAHYVYPCVSLPARRDALQRTARRVALLDLSKVAAYARRMFGWRDEKLQQRFARLVFPGALIRALLVSADFSQRDSVTAGHAAAKRGPATAWLTPRASRITDFFASSSLQSEGNSALVLNAHTSRRHASVEGRLEIRVTYTTRPYAAAIGLDEGEQRTWLPALLLETQTSHERRLLRQVLGKESSPSKRSGEMQMQSSLNSFFKGTKASESAPSLVDAVTKTNACAAPAESRALPATPTKTSAYSPSSSKSAPVSSRKTATSKRVGETLTSPSPLRRAAGLSVGGSDNDVLGAVATARLLTPSKRGGRSTEMSVDGASSSGATRDVSPIRDVTARVDRGKPVPFAVQKRDTAKERRCSIITDAAHPAKQPDTDRLSLLAQNGVGDTANKTADYLCDMSSDSVEIIGFCQSSAKSTRCDVVNLVDSDDDRAT